MTISIGYALGHIFEFLLFVYFSNTSFYPRKNYLLSNIISLCGYALLFIIGLLGRTPVSILAFFIVNIVLLMHGYRINLKNAIFYSVSLDVLSCAGEYIVVYLSSIRYNLIGIRVTPLIVDQRILFTIMNSKIIYLIGVQILKKFVNKKNTDDIETQPILIIIPMLSLICLTILMTVDIDNSIFLMICIVFLMINFIAFYANVGLSNKNKALKSLQEEYNKNKAELSEYQLLAEKYENTRIMRHDFHKQLDILKNLIATDNIQANEYMQQIQFSQRELDYAQYTDNKILNILFAQKIKECHRRCVEIHIHSTFPTLSFVSEIDTVAIFSNILDNAIEAAEHADIKEIYVDLYTVNNSYTAVRVENYTDKDTVALDGLLSTQKKNKDLHGIGIKSINNTLKKYGSELTWTYNKDQKFFRSIALFHIPK